MPYLLPGKRWAFDLVFLWSKDSTRDSSALTDVANGVDSRSASPASTTGEDADVAYVLHDQAGGSLEVELVMHRAIRGPSRSADIAA